MPDLTNLRVAILATDGFEESELTEPSRALREAGAKIEILSLKQKSIQGFIHAEKGASVEADGVISHANPENYDAVLLPGGTLNADTLRMDANVQGFLSQMQAAGKPIAAICHAPWELISAGLVKDRTLTSYYTLRDDIQNAGGRWLDQEVVVDKNWVTSRQPSDLLAFNREMLNLFAQQVSTISYT